MGRGPDQTLLQRGLAGGQQACEKILDLANYQGNANQNHNEVPPHTSQNGCHQKEHKEQMLVRMWRKGTSQTLFVGM